MRNVRTQERQQRALEIMGGKPRPQTPKKQHQCPYGTELSDEEELALHWLSQMLGDMTKACSTEHTRRALVAHTAVGKLLKKVNDLHELAHVHEAELHQAEVMLVGMVGLPHKLGLVKEEDFN